MESEVAMVNTLFILREVGTIAREATLSGMFFFALIVSMSLCYKGNNSLLEWTAFSFLNDL